MDREVVRRILEYLGSKVRDNHNGFIASCPFASYGGHPNAKDSHPSFSIKVGIDRSPWHCFTCQRRGYDLKNLVWMYERESGRPLSEIRSWLRMDQQTVDEWMRKTKFDFRLRNPEPEEFREQWYSFQGNPTVPVDELKQCIGPSEYSRKRGITDEQCLRWWIGTKNGRLLIPVFGRDGTPVGFSTRAIRDGDKPKYLHMPGFKKERFLYGEQFLNVKIPGVYLVEGFMDVLRLERAGVKNAVAIMGDSISDIQIQRVLDFAKHVVIFPHNDKKATSLLDDILGGEKRLPGMEMAKSIRRKLLFHCPSIRVQIAPIIDGVKDVGDMSDRQLGWLFEQIRKGTTDECGDS